MDASTSPLKQLLVNSETQCRLEAELKEESEGFECSISCLTSAPSSPSESLAVNGGRGFFYERAVEPQRSPPSMHATLTIKGIQSK